VIQLNAIEKDDLPPLGGLVAALSQLDSRCATEDVARMGASNSMSQNVFIHQF